MSLSSHPKIQVPAAARPHQQAVVAAVAAQHLPLPPQVRRQRLLPLQLHQRPQKPPVVATLVAIIRAAR